MKVAHIGLGKTGTSFIQRHFFNSLEVNFYTTDNNDWPEEFKFISTTNEAWLSDIYIGNSIYSNLTRVKAFHHVISRNKNDFYDSMEKFRIKNDESDYILSAEGLSGLSHEMLQAHLDLLSAAGVEKIIFVCRKQASWAISLWRQFLLSENRFSRFVSFDTLFGNSDLDGVIGLDWDLYIQKLDSQFGRENVLVLPYELLISDAVDFFRRLSFFLGYKKAIIPQNLSIRENLSCVEEIYYGLKFDGVFPFYKLPYLRRKLHRLVDILPVNLTRGIVMMNSMSVDHKELMSLQGRFFSSNRKLDSRIGISLEKFGYY